MPATAFRKQSSTAFMKPWITAINPAINSMETENNQKSGLQAQIQSLRSGNRTAIIGTLKEIRSTGSVPVLPELFELLLNMEDDQIIAEITFLLNDLKDQEAAEVLAEAIGNPLYKTIWTTLVAACWQNGLSYGKYVDTFVDVAITGEYYTAIEAFTVIEEAIGEIEMEQRNRISNTLKTRMDEADDRKKPLLHELVKVVSGYPG